MPLRGSPAHRLIALACAALGCATPARAASDPRTAKPTSWDVTLVHPGEPGDPFEMSGIVRSETGMPLAGKKVYFYHADSRGLYALHPNDPMRLTAVLRTDENGRYRIHSVFPGTYGWAAHVHFEILDSPGGGGFVNMRQEGHQAPQSELSVTVKRDADGVWRLARDLWARPSMNMVTPRFQQAPDLRYPQKSWPDTARTEIHYPPAKAPSPGQPARSDTTG